MRINKYLAHATGMSRRAADTAVTNGRVAIDGKTANPGYDITNQVVTLDGRAITPPVKSITIMLNKPTGYVVSRNGQGSRTIYDLLPAEYHNLKPIGRLDKDSSGLLLLTNDGDLANELTHPSHQKIKKYEVTLDGPLQPLHRQMITDYGVQLDDGPSQLYLERIHDDNNRSWYVTMHEGRNRQIRRTFAALGYTVTRLHRTHFGPYKLESLPTGSTTVTPNIVS